MGPEKTLNEMITVDSYKQVCQQTPKLLTILKYVYIYIDAIPGNNPKTPKPLTHDDISQ